MVIYSSTVITVTQSSNAAVLREVQAKRPGKREAYTAFTTDHRAIIAKYTSEDRNETAVKKFKVFYKEIQDT